MINLGDALHYASDGVLKATYHRVRLPREGEYKGERFSMAYFANCRDSQVLQVQLLFMLDRSIILSQIIYTDIRLEQGPQRKFPPITFIDILNKKFQKVRSARS